MTAGPRIAFYAPMKPPEDPRPSGDRRMARALLAALEAGGCTVERPSAFKSLDMTGDAARQVDLSAAAEAEAARIAAELRPDPPDLWLTYHCHYKAPDLIGPRVAAALGLPYALAEASHAAKRLSGPWARFARAAAEAIGAADLVLQPNPADRPGAARVMKPSARQIDLPPFADLSAFRARRAGGTPPHAPGEGLARGAARRLATAAMMRAGAKQRSYAVLADALARLPADAPPWRLAIAGDGPARPDVEALFAERPEARFLGALEEPALADLFADADLFVWPAVGEAYGLALLEAQAAGLPAVVGDRPGVRAVAADGETALLVPEGDAQAFADAVARLLRDDDRRRRMGAAAAARAAERDLPAAAARLMAALGPWLR
ncbi:MAG: glycosyltransferase [Marivibrio sp.]|uniref:glycosyltransferase n=1 Tax=Marivibrio sp. TaxID=2039719 RepID=UPI0032EE7886